MNTKRGCGLLPWLMAAIGMLMLQTGMAFAADTNPTEMALSLNAGESYVINNVAPGEAPAVNVITNPHALIVHNEEPGKVTLLGTEAGEWTIQVKTADGNSIKYDVTVKSIANVDINHPGVAPGPITGTGATTGTAAPVVAKMDAGTGPVGSSSSASTSSSSSTAASSSTTTTDTVTVSSSNAPASSSAPAAASADPATPPAPISHSSFDFNPSTPAASYAAAPPSPSSQTAAAAISNERFRVDPSVTLSGGELHSGAVSGGRHYLPEDSVQLQTGSSRIIDFTTKLRRVSIADTTVADIQVINPFQVNLIGHKPGFTTLAIWDQNGQYAERPVRIDPNGKQQVLLNTMVAELNRSNIENQGTNLSAALPRLGLSIVGLPGAVATPYSPNTSIVTPFGIASTGATLSPPGSLNGLLLSQGLTYGVAAGNDNYSLQGFFQYLENHQLAKILAQPHLLANSGEEAKFLSGGEIPIVVAQALNTSIVFKQFGTSVEFVPTVVGRNDIELLVKPEVSEPDYAHGVQLFGFTVPAFVTRRAETLVQLKDNQTLIIAGLILHEKKTQVQKVPYLGDLPYAGGLFRNTYYSNTETDLVMSVTPQIVQPLPDGAAVYNPTSVPELTTQQIETRRLAQPDASRPRF
jgi:pilus assembly protein CpaC